MGVGAAVRHRLGPLEHTAAERYRAAFINLDDFVRVVASLTRPSRIIEIGCGEGAVAEHICREFPAAHYTGIDIAPTPGRLFRGDRQQAEFHSISSSEILDREPEPYDLVMLVDVFHHLGEELRSPTIRDLNALCVTGELIVVKDWERTRTPAHIACYVAERYVGGDANVRYLSRLELWKAIQAGLDGADLVCEARIPPRRNNLMFALRKRA
jgi:2-polyprenyl-6-hydroxyphenyl methylase/3-demethylubiquinone-9 3-methyltransferase